MNHLDTQNTSSYTILTMTDSSNSESEDLSSLDSNEGGDFIEATSSDDEEDIESLSRMEKKTITDLLSSGDVPNIKTAKLILTLMNEFHCKKEDAIAATKHNDNFKEAAAYLSLIEEFLKMGVKDKKVDIAVELWNTKLVDDKSKAAELAKSSKTFQVAVDNLETENRSHKVDEKRLRKLNANYKLKSESEAAAIIELINKGYSEEESAVAVIFSGVDKAEKFLKQNEKSIRRFIVKYNLDCAGKCLAVIALKNLNCCEELAVELVKRYGVYEVESQWRQVMEKMDKPVIKIKLGELKFNDIGKKLPLALTLIELGYSNDVIRKAIPSCDSVNEVVSFMSSLRECDICCESFFASEMVTFLCTHEMCKKCTNSHFTERIKDHSSIYAITCHVPDCFYTKENLDYEYFSVLSVQLQSILEPDVFECFQRKLLDLAISGEKHFIYCKSCTVGFMYDGIMEKVNCPHCDHEMCPKCQNDWLPDHKNKTCEEVQHEKVSEKFIDLKLNQQGIECPKCFTKYLLVAGGCIHFTCTHCHFEFCQGCFREFIKTDCKVYEDCKSSGLHAHHPRNCHYYLRDFNVTELENLFQISNVEVPPSQFNDVDGCQCLLQRNSDSPEELCGKPSIAYYQGFCEEHYKEHLNMIINKFKLEPANIFMVDQLKAELTRNRKTVPAPHSNEADDAYKQQLLEVVVSEIPLTDIIRRYKIE
ncbi:hypothetical protein CHUAL_007350 [Chamberlinius hualienensis]